MHYNLKNKKDRKASAKNWKAVQRVRKGRKRVRKEDDDDATGLDRVERTKRERVPKMYRTRHPRREGVKG